LELKKKQEAADHRNRLPPRKKAFKLEKD
jgi:hypothetical protein